MGRQKGNKNRQNSFLQIGRMCMTLVYIRAKDRRQQH
jgi:hypothetical protein